MLRDPSPLPKPVTQAKMANKMTNLFSGSCSVLRITSQCLVIIVVLQMSEVQPLECPVFDDLPCVNRTMTKQFVTCQPDLSKLISNETCRDASVSHEFIHMVRFDYTGKVSEFCLSSLASWRVE